MNDQTNPFNISNWLTPLLTLALFVLVVAATLLILKPFFVPLTWAVVIVLTTWPMYREVRRKLPGRETLAAALMTVFLGALLMLAVVPVAVQLTQELTESTAALQSKLNQGEWRLLRRLEDVPLIGPFAAARTEALLIDIRSDPEAAASLLRGVQPAIMEAATTAARRVGNVLFVASVCLLSAFFLYRHGDTLSRQFSKAAFRLGGTRSLHLINTAKATLRGAVYGTVLTALAQGAMAGIGFWIGGAPLPVLLGFATVIISLIPIGPPFLYLGVAAVMYVTNPSPGGAIFIALWGVLVVSTVDNLLRPLFIGQATRMSVLLVLFGVLGGVIVFGMIGLFIGPAILALAQSLWLEFVYEEPGPIQEVAPPEGLTTDAKV